MGKKDKPKPIKITEEGNFIRTRFFDPNECMKNAIVDSTGRKTTFIAKRIDRGVNEGVVNVFCVKKGETRKTQKGKYKGKFRISRQTSLKPIKKFKIENDKVVIRKNA